MLGYLRFNLQWHSISYLSRNPNIGSLHFYFYSRHTIPAKDLLLEQVLADLRDPEVPWNSFYVPERFISKYNNFQQGLNITTYGNFNLNGRIISLANE